MSRAILAVLAIGISLSSAAGQGITQKAPAGTTRVAIVNVGYVFGKYEKAIRVKKELQDTLAPFTQQAKELTDKIKAWKAELENPDIDADRKDQLNTKIRKSKAQLEDLQFNAQKMITKRQEVNLVTLWKEVDDAVKTYAVQHDIDLVLAFGDPSERELLNQFPNVNRKMQAMDSGGTIPLFIRPGVDIAEPVVQLLNRRYRQMSQRD